MNKMEITLFENQVIQLINTGVGVPMTLGDGRVISGVNTRKGGISVPLTAELCEVLKSVGYFPKASVGSSLQMSLTLGFPAVFGTVPEGYLDARIDNPEILTSDDWVTSGDMQISVSISTIQEPFVHNQIMIAADPTHLFVIGKEKGRASSLKVQRPGLVCDAWRYIIWTDSPNKTYKWSVTCTAKLILSPSPETSKHGGNDPLVSIRRMLTDELYCDVTVIANNGAEVKFHRGIMASHSSVFDSMFESGMRESRTGIVELRDMSEESVRALRDYLYVWDLEGAQGNSSVCFELLEAGHRYDIPSLEKSIEKTLLQKDHDWYSVDVALRLFLFVRGRGNEGLKLKKKAVQVLKSKFEELHKLSSYKELFKKNADAAMELNACFAGHFEST